MSGDDISPNRDTDSSLELLLVKSSRDTKGEERLSVTLTPDEAEAVLSGAYICALESGALGKEAVRHLRLPSVSLC